MARFAHKLAAVTLVLGSVTAVVAPAVSAGGGLPRATQACAAEACAGAGGVCGHGGRDEGAVCFSAPR